MVLTYRRVPSPMHGFLFIGALWLGGEFEQRVRSRVPGVTSGPSELF